MSWNLVESGKQQGSVNPLSTKFQKNTLIESFPELVRFTGFTSIAANVFDTCSNLHSIDITGKTSLGNYAFQNCKRLSNMVGLMGVKTIGNYAMAYMEGAPWPNSNARVLGEDVTSLGEYSIRGYNISGSAWNNVTKKAFIIKDGGTGTLRINNSAIAYDKLEIIDLPSRTTYIGANINQIPGSGYTKWTTTYIFRSTTPPGRYNNQTNALSFIYRIYVPSDSVSAYKSDSKWSSMSSYIYAIGGTEWIAQFGSADEWADYDKYGVPHEE